MQFRETVYLRGLMFLAKNSFNYKNIYDCKVYKSGYRKFQKRMECQEMWNVSVMEIGFVDSDSFNASKINMNVKVTFFNL
jgi:hypothetical protein